MNIQFPNIFNFKKIKRYFYLYLPIFTSFLLIITLIIFIIVAREIFQSNLSKKNNLKSSSEKSFQIQSQDKFVNLESYGKILENNLFGGQSSKITLLSANIQPTSTIQLSPTDITLIGIVISDPPTKNYGIFKKKDGFQEEILQGQNVFGIGKLTEVKWDKVIITKSDSKIVLPLAGTEITEVKANQATGASNFARESSSNNYTINKEILDNSIDNPQYFMTDARFFPYIVDGVQKGFIVKEIKPNGIYDNLGFKNNDIILEINEFKILSPEQMLKVLIALKGTDRIIMNMIRANKKVSLTYLVK